MSTATPGRAAHVTRGAVLDCLEALLGDRPEPLRIVAREIQGLDGSIDAVACDAAGTPVIVGFASPETELAQLGHLLAQRAWLAPRIRDWLQLNPELPLREARPPRLLLLGAELAPATVAAAAGIEGLDLARVHGLRTAAGLVVALDPVASGAAPSPAPIPEAPALAPPPPTSAPDRSPESRPRAAFDRQQAAGRRSARASTRPTSTVRAARAAPRGAASDRVGRLGPGSGPPQREISLRGLSPARR